MPNLYPMWVQCPLSGKLLDDPVVIASGYTYDKTAILEHFKNSDKDPISGEQIELGDQRTPKTLITHWKIISLIDIYNENKYFNEKILQEKILEDLSCCISHEKYVNPIIVSSGQSYEANQLFKYINILRKAKNIEPLTKIEDICNKNYCCILNTGSKIQHVVENHHLRLVTFFYLGKQFDNKLEILNNRLVSLAPLSLDSQLANIHPFQFFNNRPRVNTSTLLTSFYNSNFQVDYFKHRAKFVKKKQAMQKMVLENLLHIENTLSCFTPIKKLSTDDSKIKVYYNNILTEDMCAFLRDCHAFEGSNITYKSEVLDGKEYNVLLLSSEQVKNLYETITNEKLKIFANNESLDNQDDNNSGLFGYIRNLMGY